LIRLDLSFFYRLSRTFDALRTLEVGDVRSVWLKLYQAQQAIETLASDRNLQSHMRGLTVPLGKLHEAVRSVIGRDLEADFSQYDQAAIIGALNVFDVVLQSDLAVTDAYLVVEKQPYSTTNLIFAGETLFPPDAARKVPACVMDLQEAGKCLAFELPTACGFHIMRAMEAVLRRYWEVVTGNKPHPKHRNIGVYLRGMREQGCGDAKVIAALTQLKDLHRNAISHPDDTLKLHEASSLIGIAQSAVAAMLKSIPDPKTEAQGLSEGTINAALSIAATETLGRGTP
jgi:hypothetical protein